MLEANTLKTTCMLSAWLCDCLELGAWAGISLPTCPSLISVSRRTEADSPHKIIDLRMQGNKTIYQKPVHRKLATLLSTAMYMIVARRFKSKGRHRGIKLALTVLIL
jgi:hypothetical protein